MFMVAIGLWRYTRRMSSASPGSTGGSLNINGILYQNTRHVIVQRMRFDRFGCHEPSPISGDGRA
jgi:hypothetical protein